MQKLRVLFWVGLVISLVSGSADADVAMLKNECQATCMAAAEMVKTQGIAAAMCEINNRSGQFVKGDIYVYMMNMDAVMMAHPMVPTLIGKNLSGMVLKDIHGKEQPMMLVNFAKDRGAGWISYMWPKPGTKKAVEKMCYILKVPDTNVFVVAGFFVE